MKKRALLYGAGKNCKKCFEALERLYTVIGIADSAPDKQGKELFDFRICSAETMGDLDWDVVIVTPTDCGQIVEQLLAAGVRKSAILTLEGAFESPFRDVKRLNVAVELCGGIGDVLIGLNWLYHVAQRFDMVKSAAIDVFLEIDADGSKRAICAACDLVRGVSLGLTEGEAQEYDLAIQFCIIPHVAWLYGEKLGALCPELLAYAMELQRFGFTQYGCNFNRSPLFYQTVRKIFERFPDKSYYSFCDLFDDLGITEDFLCPFPLAASAPAYLDELGLESGKYILINASMNLYLRQTNNTRAWPETHWAELVRLLKSGLPAQKVVQIGTYASRRVELGADLNLSGETNLEQLKVLLANARLLVDYEGGLVHMRHILHGGPAVVLFGPTTIKQCGYSENVNICADACPACAWTTLTWLSDCPKGCDPPLCMASITPERVFEAVKGCVT